MKKLTLITAIALSTIGTLCAQTDVNVTGSTAYRANTYRAIQAILNAGYTLAYNGGTAGSGTQSDLEGSNFAIFNGTLASNGHSVRIKTSFTGSEAGIQAVGKATPIQFYPDGQATGTLAAGAGAGTPSNLEVGTIDLADTQQAASNFLGRYKGFSYPTLTEDVNSPVGVIPFKFYGAPGCTITNITSQQVRALYSGGGTLPLSFFDGNSAHSGTTVNATGRNPDSGTRVTLMAESGLGSRAIVVNNIAPEDGTNAVIGTAGGAINHFAVYPSGVVNTINVAAGDNGYSSGGTLMKAVNNTTPAGTQLIGYASTNDGDPQLATWTGTPAHPGTGVVEIAFNEVLLGGGTTNAYDYNTNTNITYGSYTYWGYEHLYYGSTAAGNADLKQAADDIAGNIKSSNALIALTSMHAGRGSFTDGGTIVPQ